jgi:hypothetical protein
MRQKLKIILFIILFALLWLPCVQEQTNFFEETQLTDAFEKPPAPIFSIDSLNKLSFQKQYENYKNYNFGFKGLLIKIKNSVNYILFKEINSLDFIVGKNGFIFDINHIKRTLGIDYNGKEKNNAAIDRIKFLKDGLENRGGKLVCLLVPSKEIETLDLLPSQYCNCLKKQTNYVDFVKGLTNNDIPTIDYYQYFKRFNITTPYPFYTKTGSHWSMYGASFAHDTLVNYIEKLIGKSIPKYKRVGVEISDVAKNDDADFEGALNLLFSIGQPKYMYPKLEMIESTRKNYRPKVIIIGDSFIWQIKYQEMLQYVFSEDSKFWYYFGSHSFPMNGANACSLDSLNVIKELESADCVILEGSFGTLNGFPFGVTDYYYDNISSQEIIEIIRSNIKGNSLWMTKLNGKKNSLNLSIDEIVTAEAKRVCRDKKIISIKAANNKYVCAGGNEDETLIVNKEVVSDGETFSLLSLGDDKIAIYAHKNRFLSTELKNKAKIASTGTNIMDWETFTLIKLENDFVAFKAYNGKYLSFDSKTLKIFAIANKIGENEKFKMAVVK